jgi:acyl-coenzyme A thioesterase PaaI-like protein
VEPEASYNRAMIEPRTHLAIDQRLCGEPIELMEGSARVALETTSAMAADEAGLVHGGFVFGAADYAAMLAVNDPNVVLGAAEVRFSAPVKVGEKIIFEARVVETKGKKRVAEVKGAVGNREVLSGSLVTFVLDKHVLA